MLVEKCGVVGIYSKEKKNVATSLFYALYALQHRGQESCGITTHDEDFHTEKGMGLVPEFFNLKKIEALTGNIGIGHVRYSTTGGSRIECTQPLVITHQKGTLAIAHNGNIVNYPELKKKLELAGQVFATTTDTEAIAHLIVLEFVKSKDMVSAIAEVMKKLVGSYSLVLLTGDEVIAVRDPLGIRPLCIGKSDGAMIVASESVVFDVLNVQFLRDVKPGEILVINKKGVKSYRPFKLNRKAHCMFEYVYFARPDSVIDGVSVYGVREKIGMIHGEKDNVKADFVSPIPDSAIPFALGYSKKTRMQYKESLIKNRYVGRTFILPDQQARELAVKLKLNPLLTHVKGKKVILFDDSIVRGTTSGRIIKLLKDAGAKEVHMRVGCPPITSLCKLGIDMPTDKELIASEKSVRAIQREICADSLKYIDIKDLINAIGLPEDQLCMGCLSSKYPVDVKKSKQILLHTFIKKG